jgi:hypothetical protein
VPPVKLTVRISPDVPYFFVIVEVLDVKVIAGLTVRVATVEVSTDVIPAVAPEPVNVTIARYLNLFIAVVKATVVKVSVVKPEPFVEPLPLDISIQETDAAAVTVSVATCHLITLVKPAGAATVVIVKESVNPAVVVSLVGCREILVMVKVTSLVAVA